MDPIPLNPTRQMPRSMPSFVLHPLYTTRKALYCTLLKHVWSKLLRLYSHTQASCIWIWNQTTQRIHRYIIIRKLRVTKR